MIRPVEGEALTLPGRVTPLAALRWNAGAIHRVLAIHGWLDNAMSFAPLAEHLPDCEIVAVDLPGHGHSGHLPPGHWYHFIDYLDDALDALDALGWTRCHLLGHSLGGAVATALAAACPERVGRLLLIEALGPLALTPGKAAESLRRGIADRRGASEKQKRVIATADDAVGARLMATPMARSSAELLVSRNLENVEGGVIWRSDSRLRLASPVRFDESQIQQWIAAIEAPTLVVAADQHPPYFEPAERNHRVTLLRNGRLRVLPGQHHLHMDSPVPMAAEIAAFLAQALDEAQLSAAQQ